MMSIIACHAQPTTSIQLYFKSLYHAPAPCHEFEYYILYDHERRQERAAVFYTGIR